MDYGLMNDVQLEDSYKDNVIAKARQLGVGNVYLEDDNYYKGKKAGMQVVVDCVEPYLRSLTEMVVVMKNLNIVPTKTAIKNIEGIWAVWRANRIEWGID